MYEDKAAEEVHIYELMTVDGGQPWNMINLIFKEFIPIPILLRRYKNISFFGSSELL
jgi:hypothetical protein